MDRSLFDLDAIGRRVIPSLAKVLSSLCARNDCLPLDHVTKFHALRPPSVSVTDYLTRLGKFAACSGPCFVLSLIYIDRVISRHQLLVNSLNVHRLMITSLMTAAKFFDDQFFRNSYYAKVGGVTCEEINTLETEFLFLVNFDLHVNSKLYNLYLTELLANSPSEQALPASPVAAAATADAFAPPPVSNQEQQQQQRHSPSPSTGSTSSQVHYNNTPRIGGCGTPTTAERDDDDDVVVDFATPVGPQQRLRHPSADASQLASLQPVSHHSQQPQQQQQFCAAAAPCRPPCHQQQPHAVRQPQELQRPTEMLVPLPVDSHLPVRSVNAAHPASMGLLQPVPVPHEQQQQQQHMHFQQHAAAVAAAVAAAPPSSRAPHQQAHHVMLHPRPLSSVESLAVQAPMWQHPSSAGLLPPHTPALYQPFAAHASHPAAWQHAHSAAFSPTAVSN